MQGETYCTNDFALSVPAGWPRKLVTSFAGPVVHGVPQSIVITQDPIDEPADVKAYAAAQLAELKGMLRRFRVVEEATVTVQGEEVPLLVYRWHPQGSPELTQMQVYVVRPPFAWTVTGTTSEKGQAAFRGLFEAVAGSFVHDVPGDAV